MYCLFPPSPFSCSMVELESAFLSEVDDDDDCCLGAVWCMEKQRAAMHWENRNDEDGALILGNMIIVVPLDMLFSDFLL